MTNKSNIPSIDYKPFQPPRYFLDCVLCGETIARTDEEPKGNLKESTICMNCCNNEIKFDTMVLENKI